MKHVSLKSIEAAIKKVDNLDDDQLETLSEQYALAQETLLGYVKKKIMNGILING